MKNKLILLRGHLANVYSSLRYFGSDKEFRMQKRVEKRWSGESGGRGKSRGKKTRWWQSHYILDHIHKRVYRSPKGNGFLKAAEYEYGILPCQKGVSIACGNGEKEMALVERGLVGSFDLYDLSKKRIEEGIEYACKKGIKDKVNFYCEDVFKKESLIESYDLVYWDNALHHMMDVEEAIKWSWSVLKPGGGFLMNDFTGPSRFQWSDKQLEVASRVRRAFSQKRELSHPRNPGTFIVENVQRPTVAGMIADDPSEAADSERIIPMIEAYFPQATIIQTGGAIYHLALNDMLSNFDEEEDSSSLELLLLIDDLMADQGESHYSVAFAKK